MNDLSLYTLRYWLTALATVLFMLCANGASAAMPAPTEKLVLSPEMDQALTELIDAARNGGAPSQAAMDTVVRFSMFQGMGTGNRIAPERKEGEGVFYHTPVRFSLKDFMLYALNPAVPGESIYPNSVRRNVWYENSPVLKEWRAIVDSPLPPEKTLLTRGVEYEAITPDQNSGSYYSYDLNRVIALAPLPADAGNGKPGAALFMISAQPKQSAIGMKGAVLGPDAQWNYVYTGAKGSTLPMVGWAETYVYDSATVNIWVETGGEMTLYAYKWLKAGWSNMNVVNSGHISAGLDRYMIGLSQVLTAAKRPSVDSIAAKVKSLRAMSDEQLTEALKPYSEQIAALATQNKVSGGDFAKVLDNGAYAASMHRDDRIAELLKLYMKEQLGIPLPGQAK